MLHRTLAGVCRADHRMTYTGELCELRRAGNGNVTELAEEMGHMSPTTYRPVGSTNNIHSPLDVKQ